MRKESWSARHPAPSMPLYFWNDDGSKKYRETPTSNSIQGRTSGGTGIIVVRTGIPGAIPFTAVRTSVLKPSGVRIGTAEIYNQVEKIEGIADSLAIGQNWEGDQRVILFVKLTPGVQLTEELKDKIRKTLREKASPAPRSFDHHGDAGSPLYPEYEKGGERCYQYHPQETGL